ncbi:alkaline phosphatase family protein [Silvanigrella aquatica]|uniref:Phosphodiesterase n=1 Tax=Silvanigrella aquatica TaxID=1915309 RepID=A0A1L4CXF4_9BACT|nr:alkaline phosphatase family protein [Silvanigrella aquatica]APJ02631.1 hypothetical protein AXG55_01260 [Silvanigrella aquatica]
MKHLAIIKKIIFTSIGITFVSCQTQSINNKKEKTKNYVILYVWDGLRPDILTDKKAENKIPNLLELASNGVEFKDNHSAYPTFTMNNAQVFATGDYAGKSGFYGNTLYQPWRTKKEYGIATNAKGENITKEFYEPIFTEDYKILKALDQPKSNHVHAHEPLVQVTTLLQEAQKKGLKTVVVGKSGPAFFQDFRSGGYILDENHVWPLSFAQELQAENISLPKLTPQAYSKGQLTLSPQNGDPTASENIFYLEDSNEVSDPSKAKTSPFNKKNEYMANIFINYILPKKLPDLSVMWLRNPDSTEHLYGPGTLPYYDAIASNDKILGSLIEKLKEMGIYDKTNIIIVSDHSHSNILATKRNDSEGYPQLMYPMHFIKDDESGKSTIGHKIAADKKTHTDSKTKLLITKGFPVSGTIRTADLITKAELKIENGNSIVAYDGGDCFFNKYMGAIRNGDGSINTQSSGYNAPDGKCKNSKKENIAYTSPSYRVPKDLSNKDGIEKVIIAPNGGTDYIYIPSHNPQVMKVLVNFFQRRQEYSALFLDESRYHLGTHFPRGVLPLSYVKLENKSGRNPDIVVSMTSNANVIVNGLPGVEFDSTSDYALRGDHGSFGRIDVHNTLLAMGPNFNNAMKNYVPTGNVDVAPTIAKILGFTIPNTDGRILYESLKGSGYTQESYKINPLIVTSSASCDLEIYEPTTHPISFISENKNKFIDSEIRSFYTQLNNKLITAKDGTRFVYFDSAEAKRQKGCPKVGLTLFSFNNLN